MPELTSRNIQTSAPEHEDARTPEISKYFNLVLSIWFYGCAAWYLSSSLCAVANYGWRQPAFDQFRDYLSLLQMQFPQNVLRPNNGHHPIFPFLVILVEKQWLNANQMLQLVTGVGCALITSLIPIISIFREPKLSRRQRAAGTLLAVLGVFWLANARSLIHGNEALSVYMVSASVMLAVWCVYEAKRRGTARWLYAATVACVVATFSFGSGIASFPAAIGLAVLLRVPGRGIAILAAGFVTCVALYLFVLPGDEGVRGMLAIRPLDNFSYLARWLSSPWMTGWLALADPPGAFTSVDTKAWYGALVVDSANAFVTFTHISWRIWGVIIGFAGVLGFAVYVMRAYFSRREIVRTEAIAIGMATFAIAVAVVISIGRLDYFFENFDQVYADRYLIWGSLFWSSLGMCIVLRAHRNTIKTAGTAFLIALPVFLYATHANGVGWSAAVFRSLQANAAAVRAGVFDETQFPSDPSTGRENEWHSIELMRAQRLAMFAQSGFDRLGTRGPMVLDANESIVVSARWENAFTDPYTDKPAAHFSGFFKKGIRNVSPKWKLMALDQNGNVAGLAEYSYAGYGNNWANLKISRLRGFDGYIRHYDPTKTYTLIAWNTKYDHGTQLAVLSPSAPPREDKSVPIERTSH